MKTMRVALATLAVIGLAACEGGGVDLNVATTDNSVDNSGGGDGGSDSPCASYTPDGATEAVRGSFDGTNCIYSSSFVGQSSPLLVDLTIPFITGKHIFQDSLFVGRNVDTGAAPQEGEGPTLTIAAGNLTNNERPMTQHSDLVVNFQLGYDSPDERHSAALAYNMYSDRIFFAGRGGADDAEEQAFDSLDLTYSFHPTDKLALKLRLQNLLDEDLVIEQGGVDVLTQTVGLTTKLDVTYRF